ncbi:hypothetical protein ACHAXA_004546 [Cyclostephanos tholiformis]|uniref:Uncharacterized protein n=1 Tax=Cyclostephanos tholiformis TaxID=382380 RepID=A0ABD3R7W5_9STRA
MGEVAMLSSGISIGIGPSYRLYFLLPEDENDGSSSRSPMTMRVPSYMADVTHIKMEGVVATASPHPSKRARMSWEGQDATIAVGSPPPSSSYSSSSSSFSISASALDDMTDIELLDVLSQTVMDGTSTWDYECQRLGSAIALRACRAASRSGTVRRIVRDVGGVTLREILDWMNGNNNNNDDGGGDDDGGGKANDRSVFVEYERLMLQKIERKSFMMSMGKALSRAGYTKNELLSGRAIRWNLPPSSEDTAGGGSGGGGGVVTSGGNRDGSGRDRDDGGGSGSCAPRSFSFEVDGQVA